MSSSSSVVVVVVLTPASIFGRWIIMSSKQLKVWSTPEDRANGTTMFDALAADREVVRMVLLLTGSVEGAKREVMRYLSTFMKYEWLWTLDKRAAYADFMSKKGSSLQEIDDEIMKYVSVESEIQKIAPVHNIGALSLETAPLKSSLKSEAASWKAQYSQNLHEQAKQELERCVDWMDDMSKKLKREIKDLDHVREIVSYLGEVREMEGQVETLLGPVEEMYAMLARYEVRVTKEEVDTVGELPYIWKKLKKLSDEVNDNLVVKQTTFKKELVRNVKLFITDVMSFRNEWDSSGPTVPGITPMQGHERLSKFRFGLESKMRRWEQYRAGEELFGLQPTDYPELTKTAKEVDLLEKVGSRDQHA